MEEVHVTICICTFKRRTMLRRLLAAIDAQQIGEGLTCSVVVVDNDAERSAEDVVAEFTRSGHTPISYHCEPRKNIASARNLTVAHATGSYIAFVDDDEFPVPQWVSRLVAACREHQAAGVLGPVRPHFEDPPPRWITAGRFCERREHPTGTVLSPGECRTGNVLLRKDILSQNEPPFDERFGNGGEDVDFFMRKGAAGCRFVWCNEAVVYETVPPERWRRRFMLKRALLRGRNVLKLRRARARLLATSVVAVPVYSLLLLPTLVLGQHWFMRYCIRLCDHVGRLLAFVGLNPVEER